MSVDHNQIMVDRLYATTLAENTTAVELLKKIGFQRVNPKDVRQGFVDEDKQIYIYPVTKLVVEKNLFFTDLALNR